MIMRLFTACVLVLLLSGACAQTVVFHPSSVVPAADATAKIERDANKNARIALTVKHLADPQRLAPPKAVYVVWAETPEGRTLNLGKLVGDENRHGTLQTTTSLPEFRLLISAEDLTTASASSPNGQIILTTSFFRAK